MSTVQVDTINESTTGSGVTVDGVLIKDGNVDGVDVSGITEGITVADQFNLTTDITSPTNGSQTDITTNLSRSTGTLGGGNLGTEMSLSSGIFTFPSTGYYLVTLTGRMKSNTSPTNMFVTSTDDNFSSEQNIIVLQVYDADSGDTSITASGNALLDITDTSNDKVKLSYALYGSNSKIEGSATSIETSVSFIRLGDT